MKSATFSILFVFLTACSEIASLSQPNEAVSDSSVNDISFASAYKHRVIPLGDGSFMIVQERGLAKICKQSPGGFNCGGGWQRLPG